MSSSPLLARVSALVASLLLVIWAATGGGDFWPLWVWHELAVVLALDFALRRALVRPSAYRVHVALTAVAAGTVLSVWLLFSGGGWWIVWPLLGLALALAAHEPVRRLLRRSPLTIHAAVAGFAFAVIAAAWAGSGGGDWILWPVLGLGGVLVAHAVCHEHVTLRR